MATFPDRVPENPSERLDALADIKAGLGEAVKRDFATDAEVAATIAKYTERRRYRSGVFRSMTA